MTASNSRRTSDLLQNPTASPFRFTTWNSHCTSCVEKSRRMRDEHKCASGTTEKVEGRHRHE